MRGRFITLEGGEAGGKTTQAELLVAALRREAVDVLHTREPGGCPTAEHLRRIWLQAEAGLWQPLTEALLVYAARHEHVVTTIRPALAAGRWVVSERFADSTTVYQGMIGKVPAEALQQLHRWAVGDLVPDITFILDLPVPQVLARLGERQRDRHEARDASFHEALRQGFLELVRANPERMLVIDASQPVPVVADQLLQIVQQRLRRSAA